MITEIELRNAIHAELDSLDPMQDVVPSVMRVGAARARRRRLTTVATGVAAGLAAAFVAVSVLPDRDTVAVQPADQGGRQVSSLTTGSSRPDTIIRSRQQFNRYAAGVFTATLPARFSPVRLSHTHPASPSSWETSVGGVGVWLHLEAHRVPDAAAASDCAAYDTADSCRQRPFGDGGQVLAAHETDDAGTHDLAVDLTADGTELEMYFFASDGVAVPLTDIEALDVAGSPEFHALWRELLAHPRWVEPCHATVFEGDSTAGAAFDLCP